MDRQVPFATIVANVMPHFISRQIYTGAGKVGTEVVGLTTDDVPFQLTQRADFFEEEVGLETTLKRPIVNTRDEPHADAQKLPAPPRHRRRRQPVRGGDVPQGRHDRAGAGDDRGRLPAPRPAAGAAGGRAPPGLLRHVAAPADRPGRRHVDDRARDAVGATYDRAQKYAEEHGLECIGGDEIGDEVLRLWEDVLTGLETDPMSLSAPARLGRQAPADRRLPTNARPALGRRQAAGDGPAVPRPAAGPQSWPRAWASSASRPTTR